MNGKYITASIFPIVISAGNSVFETRSVAELGDYDQDKDQEMSILDKLKSIRMRYV